MVILVFLLACFVSSARVLGNGTIDEGKIVLVGKTDGNVKLEIEGEEDIFKRVKTVSSEDLHGVGDVVFSYFNEGLFSSLRIGEWVLLDGRALSPESSLAKIKGWSSVPDMRDKYFWQASPNYPLGTVTTQRTSAPQSGITISTQSSDQHCHSLDGTGYIDGYDAGHQHNYWTRRLHMNLGTAYAPWFPFVFPPNVCICFNSASSSTSSPAGSHSHSMNSAFSSWFSRTHTHSYNSPWSTHTRPASMKINAYIRIN